MSNVKVREKESPRSYMFGLIDRSRQVWSVITVACPKKSRGAHGRVNLVREIKTEEELGEMMTRPGERALRILMPKRGRSRPNTHYVCVRVHRKIYASIL